MSDTKKTGVDTSAVRLETQHDTFWSRFKTWVANNKCLGGALVGGVVLLIIAAAVLIPLGVTGAFNTKKNNDQDFPFNNMPRNLILQYTNLEINVLDRVPKSLLPFLANIRLDSSNLQVLTADTEKILRAVYKHLKADPDLVLLVRDTYLNIPAILNRDLTTPFLATLKLLESQAAASSGGGRRLSQTTMSTSDPMFQYQWHLQDGEAYSAKPQKAWSTSSGSRDIIVAVVDTGVDYTHPDLAANMWVNSREIPGDKIDNDGNGFVDDYWGWNFGSNSNDVMDTNGHGSNVAGIIAAVSNNNLGVGSLAFSTRIMNLRITDSSGYLSLSNAMNAYNYALAQGAAIVSCSWGPGWYSYSNPGYVPTGTASKWEQDLTTAYIKAITPLQTAGVMVVAAAGNENMNLDNLAKLKYFYGPCLIPLDNVICVLAGDRSSANKAYFSNFGSTTVDVGAPGVSMCSTICKGCYSGGDYACYDGTSQATPVVSAVLAMTLAARGNPKFVDVWREVRDIVLQNGTVATTLPSIYKKRVNAFSAVSIAASRAQRVVPINVTGDVTLPGVIEEYYANPTAQLVGVSTLGSPLDNSIRAAGFPITSYKQSGGTWLYRAYGLVQLSTAGSWGLRVVTDKSFAMSLNGQRLIFTNVSTTYSLNVMVAAAGWFNIELLVQSPSTRIDVTWQAPSTTVFIALANANFMASLANPTSARPAGALLSALQSPGFLVSYATQQSIITRAAVASLKPSANSTNLMAGTTDLDFSTPGSWGSFLFPTLPTNASAYGFVNTTLAVSPGTSYAFEMSCTICQLTINGQVVVDIWENTLKTSACVSFVAGGVYDLVIKFGENDLTTADHTLRWAPCSMGVAGSMASVAPKTAQPLLWQPSASSVGYADGMACDIYLASNILTTRPDHKVRVMCGRHLTDECVLPFNLTVNSLVPNAMGRYPASSGQLFSYRCTTMWNGNFTTLTATTSDVGTVSITTMGLPVPSAASKSSFISRGMFQQLVITVRGVTSETITTVNTANGTLAVDPTAMLSPILPFAGDVSFVGPDGHSSDSWPWSSLDIGNAVPYGVSNGRASFNSSVRAPDRGLDGWYANYPNATGTWTYAWCKGFLKITQAGNYTFSINEDIGQGVVLVIDGTAIKNSPQWNSRRTTAQNFQVFAQLAPGLYYIEVVSKATGSSHLWSVSLPGGPIIAGTLIQSLQ